MRTDYIRYAVETTYSKDERIDILDIENNGQAVLTINPEYNRYAAFICAELNKIDAMEKFK